MILFDLQGHLTDEAIRAVIAETLDELARLEVAEHLSFCDNCLVRYTAMLTDDTLLVPQAPLAPPILQRIRQKTVRVLFNKYTTYAAAAGFALVLWGTGVFSVLVPQDGIAARTVPKPPTTATVQKDDGFLRGLNTALGDMLWDTSRTLSNLLHTKPATAHNGKQQPAQSTATTQKDNTQKPVDSAAQTEENKPAAAK